MQKYLKCFCCFVKSAVLLDYSRIVHNMQSMKRRLTQDDFSKPSSDLARYLLGKVVVRCFNNEVITGKIVETESYPGADDKCSHSYNYKQTERNKAMFMSPGTLYVYMTYGMYFCMNISSKGAGSAVLIRALEPLEGIEAMEKERRKNRKVNKEAPFKIKNLCDGPSKLCQAFSITREMDQVDLTTSNDMWIADGEDIPSEEIVTCTRIGLNPKSAGFDALLRYYVKGNKYVSVLQKKKLDVSTSSQLIM